MYKDFELKRSRVFEEVLLIKPDVFEDHRGALFTDYLKSFYNEEVGNELSFDHSKYAHNRKDVLRGIHGDFESWKLVSCVYGEIFQVVVDNRKDSSTYLKYDCFELDYRNPLLILMPPGFGNAFYVKSDFAVYNYKLSYVGNYNDCDEQFTMKWNDPKLNIPWPTNNPILSGRDK